MAKDAIVRARIEFELKEKVETILNKIGLTPSQAIRLFLKQVELNNGLPFNLSIPNKITQMNFQSRFYINSTFVIHKLTLKLKIAKELFFANP